MGPHDRTRAPARGSDADEAGHERDRAAAGARQPVVARLARYGRLVEVGVGRRPGVAAALAARGRTVVVTDVRERAVSAGVRFVRDDVTDPDPAVYAGADAVYALNCPPELQRPARAAAAGAGAPFLFTTLGGDPALVGARRERAGDDTLFIAEPSTTDTE